MTHTILDAHPPRCALCSALRSATCHASRHAPRHTPHRPPHRPPRRTAQDIAFDDAHVSGPDLTPNPPSPYVLKGCGGFG